MKFSPKVNLEDFLCLRPSSDTKRFMGSFKNEALENEDRSTKHPNLENEAPKTRKRRSQNSKTKLLNQVEAADASAPPKVHKIHPKVL